MPSHYQPPAAPAGPQKTFVPRPFDEPGDPEFDLSYPVSIQLRTDVFIGGLMAKNLDLRMNDKNWKIMVDYDRCIVWLRVERGNMVSVGLTPLDNVLSMQFGAKAKVGTVLIDPPQG